MNAMRKNAMQRRWADPEWRERQCEALRRAHAWPEAKLAFLKANWETMRAADIAEALGKTPSAVIGKANRLGLPPIPPEEVRRRQRVTHARRLGMKSTTALLRDLSARTTAEAEKAKPEPFLDHKVYPQGWTYAMIEREAARRYRSIRDVERQQDWLWAVDDPTVWRRMSQVARQAAHLFYEHQQRARGDFDRVEEERSANKGFYYLGESWATERSRAIASTARGYVFTHPEATDARLVVFKELFEVKQPTLELLRFRARVGGGRLNAKGKRICIGQKLMIERIVWCCETLADIDAGLTNNYGPVVA